jgi:beta-glucanase (GH16 family)
MTRFVESRTLPARPGLFLALWVLVMGGGGCSDDLAESNPAPASGVRADWPLVWAEEFDGEALDQENWNVEVVPDPHNQELQYYPGRIDSDPGANIWVEDGVLLIEARREDYGHRRYTSGRINTRGKQEFLYGRFEARIRQPGEVGMWPAFWLLGANIDEVGWPVCGEIDIMEGKGRLADWTSGALHAGPSRRANRIRSFEHELEQGSFHDSWHVFAVEWEPQEIRWFVDGTLVHTIPKPRKVKPAYWPFDHGHPFYVILNLAVGGWFDKRHPPPETSGTRRLRRWNPNAC